MYLTSTLLSQLSEATEKFGLYIRDAFLDLKKNSTFDSYLASTRAKFLSVQLYVERCRFNMLPQPEFLSENPLVSFLVAYKDMHRITFEFFPTLYKVGSVVLVFLMQGQIHAARVFVPRLLFEVTFCGSKLELLCSCVFKYPTDRNFLSICFERKLYLTLKSSVINRSLDRNARVK